MESIVSETSRYGFGALLVLTVLFVLAAPIFWRHTQLPEVRASESYENSDLYQFVFPTMHFAYGRVRAGQFPLWNTRQLCGIPLWADHRLGLFQPLNAVFLFSDTGRAMALHSFICLALMGFGFVLFCRSLDLAYGASLIGGVIYAFSGVAAAAISRPYLATALVWLPFLFWSCREFARFGYHRWLIMGGLFAAALIFSGAYALVALVIPLAAVYTLLHGFSGRRDEFGIRDALGGILLAGTLALCLTGAQWIPTMAWARDLSAPAKALWYLRVGGELPGSFREAIVQTFTARQGDLPRLCYVGIIPLILLPAAFFQRKHWRETALFVVVGAIAWFMGIVGPPGVFGTLPREACFCLSMFCVAVLTALGADRVLQPHRDYHSPPVWPAAIVVLAALTGVFYMAGSQGRGYAVAFAILLAPFLLLRKTWVSVLVSCAMALLAFLDLTVANVNVYGHPYQDLQEQLNRYTESFELTRERALGGRVMVSSRPLEYGLPANLGMLVPMNVVGGRNLFAS
ncbi:MAG: YfhO family protein, partial [Candidatus Hydrogenedentes bacterium]|nr:YfhO family protein [Candidatus Hydrogenedentota bacterium]